jgi:Tfp pilus assembly protein FimT
LIELILVMALLAIVLSVSAPALSGFFRGRTLDSEGRRLVSLIRYGQSRAVSEGVPMSLWIDPRRGSYGLEQEPGFTDGDRKAVNFSLNRDLQISVTDLPTVLPSSTGQGLRRDPSVPRLRFQPDGFIGESSPQTVVLHETKGESLFITQTRNRMSYEIHGNTLANALRSR